MSEILHEAVVGNFLQSGLCGQNRDNSPILVPANGLVNGVPVTGVRALVKYAHDSQIGAAEGTYALSPMRLLCGTIAQYNAGVGSRILDSAGWTSHPGNLDLDENGEHLPDYDCTQLTYSGADVKGLYFWLQIFSTCGVDVTPEELLKFRVILQILGGEIE